MDEEEDSQGGSLFSGSEGDASKTNRIRPITLRPRKTISISRALSPLHSRKSEPSRSIENRPPSTFKLALSSPAKPSLPTKPPTESIHVQMKSRKEIVPNSIRSTLDPTITVEHKKRPPNRPAESDSSPKKQKMGIKSIQPTSKQPQTSQPIPPPAESETSQDYISRYWKQYFADFPSEIRELPTIDKLALYFRETEILRIANHTIRRDEEERRREMVLMGERIKLMNQQVARDTRGPGK